MNIHLYECDCLDEGCCKRQELSMRYRMLGREGKFPPNTFACDGTREYWPAGAFDRSFRRSITDRTPLLFLYFSWRSWQFWRCKGMFGTYEMESEGGHEKDDKAQNTALIGGIIRDTSRNHSVVFRCSGVVQPKMWRGIQHVTQPSSGFSLLKCGSNRSIKRTTQ